MQIYNVYQSGKRLYIDEKEIPDNKIVVNKYENEVTTLRLVSDGTLPPRLYWALRNPKLSNKYFILKLVNNEDLIVGTDISAYPGLWDMLLIGTDEDYEIEGTDIDQSRLTYVSDHFGRLFVRDNFLEELDFEEQCSPTFKVFYDEIMFQLHNKVDKKDISAGGNIEVDDVLDKTSTNPVQNKVITKEVNSLKQKDESLDKEVIALRERNAELEETIEKLQIKVTTDKSPFHHITDSANMKVLDFGMEGITEQETTEGNQLFDISKVNSKYVSGNDIVFTDTPGGVYLPSLRTLAPTLKVGDVIYIYADISNGRDYFNVAGNKYFGKPIEITDSMLTSSFIIYANEGTTKYSNFTISYNSTKPTTYEPYTGGMPSPNPTHPQEIKLAGVLNEATGRYEHKCVISDENEENSQQFTLTSPVPLTKWDKLVKRDGVWGWSVNSVIRILDGSEPNWQLYRNYTASKVFQVSFDDKAIGTNNVRCTHFRLYAHSDIWNNASVAYNAMSGVSNSKNIRINVTPDFADLTVWKEYLSANQIILQYQTESEQAFIPLPEEEQTLLNNLETYYGVTNVYNEQGCPMWLEYVQSPQICMENVNKKIEEINNALLSLGANV